MSKWSKIGKRAIVKEAEKYMDMAMAYEKAYLMAMTSLRQVDRDNALFDLAGEKLLKRIDKSLKAASDSAPKVIAPNKGIITPEKSKIIISK